MSGVLFAAIALAAPSHPETSADSPWGVPLGRKAVKATIAQGGDVDSYMVAAVAGARLDVTLRIPKSSALQPILELRGPNGAIPEATFEAQGRSVRLRSHVVATTGPHEIRVAGLGLAGSGVGSGDYAISAKVRGKTSVALKGVLIRTGEERIFPFAAAGGAKLTFTLTGRSSAPDFVRIEGPGGLVVSVPPESVRRSASRRLKSKTIRLPATYPFGEWKLIVRASSGALDGVKVRIHARGGELKVVRGRLQEPEPRLTAISPSEAGVGSTVRLAGSGLLSGKKSPLRVFVGGVEAVATDVAAQSETEVGRGTNIDIEIPAGVGGEVDVTVLTAGGHAEALRAALLIVPPPRPTSVEPSIAPSSGGALIEVRGSGFRPGAAVTVAGTAFPERTEFVSAALLRFTTPPFAGGPQTLGVRDATGQEGSLPGAFVFVAAPFVQDIRPPLIPLLLGERTRLEGGNFSSGQVVRIGNTAATAVDLVTSRALDVTLPILSLGLHDVIVGDAFGQEHVTPDGLTVFTFAAGPAFDDATTPPADDLALLDFDADGDLDVFLVVRGGPSIATKSLLRVLRNDGDAGLVDVTASVMPAIDTDDWRGRTIAFGDVAADVGRSPPDGWPDLVIGTLDTSVLPADRSRVRVLANRSGPGGRRIFVDRTAVVMSATSPYDDWRAEDLWIGDLDGDGGVPDIVATHNEVETGVSPLSPYYTYYLSGTRAFSFASPEAGGYGRFAHQSRRFPNVIGTQIVTPGFPLCGDGGCADDYTPFRGTSLVVTDLDDDGRKDVAVTTPDSLSVRGSLVGSTQIARNEMIDFQAVMTDRSRDVNVGVMALAGEISLAGDVAGGPEPDLVIVRRTATGSGLAIDIAENRGFGVSWRRRTQDLLPVADGAEALQAHAAQLADIDGDGDLDLVLLTITPPTGGATTTGLGLRLLRNHGEAGLSRELETLLPDVQGEDWSGAALAIGDFHGDGGLAIVIARADAAGTGTEVRVILRTTSE